MLKEAVVSHLFSFHARSADGKKLWRVPEIKVHEQAEINNPTVTWAARSAGDVVQMSVPQRASEHQSAVTRRPDLHERPAVPRSTVLGHLGVRPDVSLVADGLVERRVDAGAGWWQAVATRGRRAACFVEVLVDSRAAVVNLLHDAHPVPPDVFRLEPLYLR